MPYKNHTGFPKWHFWSITIIFANLYSKAGMGKPWDTFLTLRNYPKHARKQTFSKENEIRGATLADNFPPIVGED